MSCWIICCLGSAQKLAGFQDGLWAHVFLNHLIGAKTENIYTACGHIFESSYWRETENIYSMWTYFWIILLARKLKISRHVDIYLNYLIGAKTENIYSMWTYFFRILLFPSSILWIGVRHFLCCLARVLFWGETFSYFKLDTRDTDVWLPLLAFLGNAMPRKLWILYAKNNFLHPHYLLYSNTYSNACLLFL